MAHTFPRVIVIVLDSVGIGELPDASVYGDQGSNTLRNIARQVPLKLPTLRSLGLANVADIGTAPEDGRRVRAFGRMNAIVAELAATPRGFIFTNLVDFDTQYGHRNDVSGYAENLERFDAGLADLLPRLDADDLLVITADHGNDPTTASTDHAREYVPVLAYGTRVRGNADIGTRRTFADLGQTLAENFGLGALSHGTSFLREIIAG